MTPNRIRTTVPVQPTEGAGTGTPCAERPSWSWACTHAGSGVSVGAPGIVRERAGGIRWVVLMDLTVLGSEAWSPDACPSYRTRNGSEETLTRQRVRDQ